MNRTRALGPRMLNSVKARIVKSLFTWYDADYKGKFGSRPCNACLETTKVDGQSQKDNVKIAFNAAPGGVGHEAHVHAEFGVVDLCVRCGEAVEDLEHNVGHCTAWNIERRAVGMPASALDASPCDMSCM
eukprot:2120047-Amphidinium_carterae.1